MRTYVHIYMCLGRLHLGSLPASATDAASFKNQGK